MRLPSYKTIIIVISGFFITAIIILLFVLYKERNNLTLKPSLQESTSISKITVSYDPAKIPDSNIQKEVKSIKNISVMLSIYDDKSPKFPISTTSTSGKYQYNVEFGTDTINIFLGIDPILFSNTDNLKKLITRLTIASSMQKYEKQVSSGDLFNQDLRSDNSNYLLIIINSSKLNGISIASLSQ